MFLFVFPPIILIVQVVAVLILRVLPVIIGISRLVGHEYELMAGVIEKTLFVSVVVPPYIPPL